MTWVLVPCDIGSCRRMHGVQRRPSRSGLVDLTGGLGAADREDARGRPPVADKDGGLPDAPEVPLSGLRGPRQPYDGPLVSPLRSTQAERGDPPLR